MSRSIVDVLGRSRTPAEPGPGAVSSAALRALDVAIGRRVDGLLAGDFRSAFAGVGSELHQVRPYAPGDDVRRIDWAVTARTGQTHVRVELAERVLVTWIVLDLSASMGFGTALRRKTDVAEGVAIALGHVGTRRGNRLGVVVFGGQEPIVRRPAQGRRGLLTALAAMREQPAGSGSLARALDQLHALAHERSLVVVVSDFRGGADWQPALRRVATRHRTLAIEIDDPREQELVDVGELRVMDPESGEQLVVDTQDPVLRREFARAAAEERRAVAAALSAAGVPHVALSTAREWLEPLGLFLATSDRR